MVNHLKRLVCVAALLASPVLFAERNRAQGPAAPVKTAEQEFKNIQVLKGIPASELQPTMGFIAASLGVNCNYCHVGGGAFEKDDKKTKQTARRMMQMVRAINDSNFAGQTAVTCNTCHRGSPLPSGVPSLTASATPAPATTTAATGTLPTVEQLLDKYIDAIGGKAALANISTRVVKGSRVNADGTVVPTEVYQKAPDKVLIVVNYPNISYFSAFNGAGGWSRDSRGPTEMGKDLLAMTTRDAEFFFGTRFTQLYTGAKVGAPRKVGDRDAYVVTATTAEGGTERLFFDTTNSLLLQRHFEVKTPLGPYPFQIRYEDYRQVDGVMLPFTIQWSRPGIQWSRKVTEVKHNVPVDETKFNRPAP